MTNPKQLIKGTPLMQAFLVYVGISALLLVLLVSGVLARFSHILRQETELAAYVLPNLQLAHQFSSATAGLQSQGQLLRSATTTDELIARNKLLEDSIRLTRALLESRPAQQDIDTRALKNTIDQIHVVVIALYNIREKQLSEVVHLQQKTDSSILELDEMLAVIQSRVVQLSGRLQKIGEVLTAARNIDSSTDKPLSSYATRSVGSESIIFNIQQYVQLTQDLERLKSLVQRLPLINSNDAVTRSIEERDLLVQSLNLRASQVRDDEAQALLKPLKQVSDRLGTANNPFEAAQSLIALSQLQKRLSLALTALTDEVPAVAEQIRSQSEGMLVDAFKQTRSDMESYRWTLLAGLGISLLMLGTVCYWLVYRQTVLPLGQISGQLDSVGTENFTSNHQPYFIQEMSDLSIAVNDLDLAQKEMQRKDVQLSDTNRELRRVNEELQQFAHVASHDLQEPLRMLQQFSGLLAEDYQSELDDDGKFYIKAISTSAHRMSTLICDTLEYASSAQTHQSMKSVDLQQILELVIKDKKFLIDETNATIAVGNLPCVMANATGMTQLFGNLLVNAIKYRREDVPIQITVNAHYPTTVAAIEITFQDNGMGIERKYLKRIFTPFERLVGSSVPGTGLGLAICTKVCESHDWTIDVSSEVGAGSRFRVLVPLAQVAKKAA